MFIIIIIIIVILLIKIQTPLTPSSLPLAIIFKNISPIYMTGPCGNVVWEDESVSSGITSFESNVTG